MSYSSEKHHSRSTAQPRHGLPETGLLCGAQESGRKSLLQIRAGELEGFLASSTVSVSFSMCRQQRLKASSTSKKQRANGDVKSRPTALLLKDTTVPKRTSGHAGIEHSVYFSCPPDS